MAEASRSESKGRSLINPLDTGTMEVGTRFINFALEYFFLLLSIIFTILNHSYISYKNY